MSHQRYTPEFKDEAIRQVTENGPFDYSRARGRVLRTDKCQEPSQPGSAPGLRAAITNCLPRSRQMMGSFR
jgi:hypothetical protein